MYRIIIGGVALAGTLATAAYKHFSSSDKKKPTSLGRFAVWGRPNSGKTTFIERLRGRPISDLKRETTTTRTIYKGIPLMIRGNSFQIDEIVDMPGNDDRRNDWIKLVGTHEHIFYLINIARKTDRNYMTEVRKDLLDTVEALRKIPNSEKRLNIIASHVDECVFIKSDPAEIINVLQADDEFRRLYELMGEFAGYVYTVNFMDTTSFDSLLKSIVSDSHA